MNNKKYIFSIIMPIYNVDKWLEEAVDSIISQKNINFEEDIQLIFVNDCSPDSSEEICIKYQNAYKNNILYIKNKQNMGLSATRNHGLQYATGQYINFFDPDDKLSPNTLSEVQNFFYSLKEPPTPRPSGLRRCAVCRTMNSRPPPWPRAWCWATACASWCSQATG